ITIPIMQAVISSIRSTMPSGTELSKFKPLSMKEVRPNVVCWLCDFSPAAPACSVTDSMTEASLSVDESVVDAVDESLCDDCADAITLTFKLCKYWTTLFFEIIGMQCEPGQCSSRIQRTQPPTRQCFRLHYD